MLPMASVSPVNSGGEQAEKSRYINSLSCRGAPLATGKVAIRSSIIVLNSSRTSVNMDGNSALIVRVASAAIISLITWALKPESEPPSADLVIAILMIPHDLSSKEWPGRILDGVAGSFRHFSLLKNPTTRSQVIGLVTILEDTIAITHMRLALSRFELRTVPEYPVTGYRSLLTYRYPPLTPPGLTSRRDHALRRVPINFDPST
ncbi:hypothetical protein L2E82_45294 [Cichorium intybus]|uniref:Uncharacterized protein n=1 Tax=Cichorium intybus TaxID=13427 RepID=A0ACB8ZRL6_CICIN|nr:hypothetical protein L2E82_45294 [Cichorium intybus]